MERLDVIVIGAGVVGLAVARALALAGREVVVAEKEPGFGSGISARNSGVIHAGIYYPQDSLKARLCVAGRQKLYEYAEARGVPYRHCGKLLVACDGEDEAKLDSIVARAAANGVNDLRTLSVAEARALEPELSCTAALLSPSTGIIDIHSLMEAFIADIEDSGGVLACGNGIESIRAIEDGFLIETGGESLIAQNVVNAAGLDAQGLASRIEGLDSAFVPKLARAKGNYFSVSGKAPFSRLVYPVPVPGGLGAHFTMNIAGESLFGPDVEWLEEGQAEDYTVDPARAESFYRSVERFWPGVKARTLIPAYAGIRPKIVGPGEKDGDFVIQDERIHGLKGLVNLFGIESPGLTASMAIAEEVARRLSG
ncbi:MAG: NAD(P)/FAD-dependent oxidoreductase [Alphaproteobacteria bacterium]|nr:NAD(P)/FAD-dependent oxidoreductase [Alphaproteobacteria bacterium]